MQVAEQYNLHLRGSPDNLDLNNKHIGDEGAKVLADALRTNTSVERLYLWNTGIGDDGAKALAAVLASNASLKDISLGGNRIGDEGGKALAAALRTNTTLRLLYLGNNRIRNEAKQAMAKMFADNYCLIMIDGFQSECGAVIERNKRIKAEREKEENQRAHQQEQPVTSAPHAASVEEVNIEEIKHQINRGTLIGKGAFGEGRYCFSCIQDTNTLNFGGGGAVFKISWRRLGVAVKVLQYHTGESALRELRNLAALRSPYLVFTLFYFD